MSTNILTTAMRIRIILEELVVMMMMAIEMTMLMLI